MTLDITEEEFVKRQLRNIRYDCLRLAIESNVAHQDGDQLIDTVKKIYNFLEAEDK